MASIVRTSSAREPVPGHVRPSRSCFAVDSIPSLHFMKRGMPTIANRIRSVGYITTMGSVFSAVTQLADLGVAVYKQGQGKFLGYIRPSTYTAVLRQMISSTMRLNKYKLKHLGLDKTILRELSESDTPLRRTMNVVFTATGLRLMDMVGKETYVNTVMKKYEKSSKPLDLR